MADKPRVMSLTELSIHLLFCILNFGVEKPRPPAQPSPTGLLANLCLWLEMEAGEKGCWWFGTAHPPVRKAACHVTIIDSGLLHPFLPWDTLSKEDAAFLSIFVGQNLTEGSLS